MDTKPKNPLSKHFRKPAIYIKLPSQGKFWKEGSLDLPVIGEIPVMPMTTADEVTLKTPDALMNGQGVVDVVQSCCPNITDAWEMPGIDVDYVLISIRIASYGQYMPITAKCPHCNNEHDYDVDLNQILSQVKTPDYSQPLYFDGLKIFLKPQKYRHITQINQIQYEERRIATALSNESISEKDRAAILKESAKKIVNLNETILVNSTNYIETEDSTQVTDLAFLSEFYKNADAKVSRLVEDKLTDIANQSTMPPTEVKCNECLGNFSIPLEFDYSRFFDLGS